ncbi:MAG: MauE/DoxX family redox-associated membrane protein [Candidatus Firestonebacteria bacterium]
MKHTKRIKKVLSNPMILFFLRLIIGIIFIFASITKIIEPEYFKAVIAEYKILPDVFVPLFAVILPWIELLCGMMLILNIFTRSNALIIIGILCVFTIGMSVNLYQGIIHDCGCFDLLRKEDISLIVIIRDLIFILLTLPILLYAKNI